MNERITEDIVRTHLKADPLFSQAILEEQKSKNPRIEKALKSASKSGGGVGKPEFILTFPAVADFMIVIECKADATRHESSKRNRYGDFAVDGVLLYASHLSRHYDVLAIAVSGQDIASAKVSHFVWNRRKPAPEETPDRRLLSLQSYLAAYKGRVVAAQVEGLKLTEKAVEYNEFLHQYSIPETERATFISAILVALQDDAFRTSYRLLETPADLAASIIDAASRVLTRHGIDADRRDLVLSQYKTIQNQDIAKSPTVKRINTPAPVPNTILREITIDIEEHVFPLTTSGEQGYDVLGRFYTEFIRYSGSDARTGLVLTPQHITRLFCELVGLTTDDIVIDPCCGTGGFLTAAMQYMWDKAGNDHDLKERIKSKQLIGIERRVDMFTHACSNMMMRGDGKSNIYRGDCFDPELQAKVQKLDPTVAMLNPPYDVGAAGQLHFVETAMELLGKGRCVAICQMSTAVSADGDVVDARRRLLEKHTLEGVVGMPQDLFHPVGVVTCVMVFRANTPHPAGYKTYFGYWRDDGFVKRKRKGRISDGSWPDKKKKMLDSFINRESRPGLSVMQSVAAADEWCAEAYMKTDYSGLSDDEFTTTIKNFVAFRLTESRVPVPITTRAASKTKRRLNERKWSEFRIDALFEVRKGRRLTKADMELGETPFIGAIETNNGLTNRIEGEPQHPGNTVTVVYNGNSVAEAFYQEQPFWCSDDVNVLYPRFEMSPEIGLFVATILRREKYRFSYGRKWNKARMETSMIQLPASNGEPDWAFMLAYMRGLPFSADLQPAGAPKRRQVLRAAE
ncbi:type I restriction enzyme M protein [Bradyrhizobium elkanii]|uniref:N-6 DNA methylase n=1 Tax=Bradyrhizobium elkanii TaxID=29448 RepID=UPI00351878DF